MPRIRHESMGVLTLSVLLASTQFARAAVKPACLFTDNAVLQQKQADPVWGTADPGEAISVPINGQTVKTSADASGAWSAKLAPIAAGGPYTLTIAGTGTDTVTLKNVLVGEVWICGGQSNMEYGLAKFIATPPAGVEPVAADPMIHFVMIPRAVGITPQSAIKCQWVESKSDDMNGLSAVGYYFGRALRKKVGVPIGLIHDNVGGTPAEAWTSKEALEANPELKHYVDEEQAYPTKYPKLVDDYNARLAAYTDAKAKSDADPTAPKPPAKPNAPLPYDKWTTGPMHLYNGMIAPIIPYGIRGAIWYQGESNAGMLGYEYRELFPAMITDWRARWGQGDFPFLYVQLAGFQQPSKMNSPRVVNSWPAVREAQRLTLSLPNTGMAVITDLSAANNIHPVRKPPVAARLALIARATVYGEKGLEYSGPVLDTVKFNGATARVTFTHADGLKAIDVHDDTDDGPLFATSDKLVGFEMCGADGKYCWADATIDGKSVILTSANVKAPIALRYGWGTYPVCNLSNAAGLPASPFRFDMDPWTTAK